MARRTRNDFCNKGHSLIDAVERSSGYLRCSICIKDYNKKDKYKKFYKHINIRNSKSRQWFLDLDDIYSLDEEDLYVRVDPIIFIEVIYGYRWSVINRVDGSRIVIKIIAKKMNNVPVEWYEVPK